MKNFFLCFPILFALHLSLFGQTTMSGEACESDIISPTHDVKDMLWCRYVRTDGTVCEKKGLDARNNLITYSGDGYFWGCPDPLNPNLHVQCPHPLGKSRDYPTINAIFSNVYFIINNSSFKSELEFRKKALKSCEENTPHFKASFLEYGIRSSQDAASLAFVHPFHPPFFKFVPTQSDSSFPFSRIVAFGDSLSDSGNRFGQTGQPGLPYFAGRYTNGPVWLENILKRLNEKNSKAQFNLYNYANGGAGVMTTEQYPTNFHIQVENYLNTMDMSEADSSWDPAYDRTLYTMLAGLNDYLDIIRDLGSSTNPGRVMLSIGGMNCANFLQEISSGNGIATPRSTTQCASACAMNIVNHFTKDVDILIEHSIQKSGISKSAKYFVIPTLPSFNALPLFNGTLGRQPQFIIDFATSAINFHNEYLKNGINHLQSEYSHIKILNLDLYTLIDDFIQSSGNEIMQKAQITDVKSICAEKDIATLKCNDPASHLFWDPVHPTMTGHCVIAENALVEIYDFFTNKTYKPKYKECHNSLINPSFELKQNKSNTKKNAKGISSLNTQIFNIF